MHEYAENGVASHWSYKHGDVPPGGTGPRFRWVQDLLEILDDSAAPDEFLENTKLELYQESVFCFTPKGELIQLPRGATPVDFAYAVHSQVGDTCVGAKINGRLMPLRHQLENGDQVEIMTARGGEPSPAWERFVVTGRARARIRRHVAQQQRAATLENGRGQIAKAFRQEGLDGSDKALEPALKTLRQATLDDLFVAVGNGQVGPRDVINALYPELRATQRAPHLVPGLLARPAAPRGPHTPITGLVAGMDVQYAKCCHPVPGDPIVGIVTTGKGVTIHVRDCATLESFASTPERYIDVGWDGAAAARPAHTGRIRVVAGNEPRALGDLASAVARQQGALSNLRVVNRQPDFMEILADVEVADLRHLHMVMAGLRAVGGVTQVDRATS
jgi:GTP diphosphokinase / guanosine-3',5'-bis(diphosphate) 3'-diphosphatase